MELAKVKSQGQTEMLGKIIDQAEIDVWLGGNDLFVEGEENCFTRSLYVYGTHFWWFLDLVHVPVDF